MSDVTSDQWEAATEQLLKLLILQTEHPGAVGLDDLPDWLRLAADQRDKHGDFVAGRLLEAWAERVKEADAQRDHG